MADGKTVGDFSKYALARLFLFIERKGFDGLLNTRLQGKPVKVYFKSGKPVFTDLWVKNYALGRMLIESGALEKDKVIECLSSQQTTGELIGREAVRRGYLEERLLARIIEQQQKQKLPKLFALKEGGFELETASLPERFSRELTFVDLNPLEIVFEGVCANYDSSRLESELDKIYPMAVALKDGDVSVLRSVLKDEERRFVAALLKRGYWLTEDLIAASRLDKVVVLETLYILWAADFLKLDDPDTVPRLRPKSSLLESQGKGKPRHLTEQLAVVGPHDEKSSDFDRDAHVGGGVKAEASVSSGIVDEERKVNTQTQPVKRYSQSNMVAHGVTSGGVGVVSGSRAVDVSGVQTAPHSVVGGGINEEEAQSSSPHPDKRLKRKVKNPVGWPRLPEEATDQVKQMDKELRRRLSTIQDQNLFEILDVGSDATRKQIKESYLVLAKKFHPDRVSSLGVEVLREPADRLFQRISEAFTTLLDDSQREEYRAIVKDSSLAGGRQKARQILEAEISFQKGEVFFRKGNYQKAEEMFSAALEGNPDEGEHLAMLAWTRYVSARKTGAHDNKAEDLKNMLMESLSLSPRCAKANYFLGKILLDQGKEDAALPHFERAVHLDSNYVEPAREINIIRMRKARGSKPVKSSFWNKLKGKKDSG